jgi:hypothetical protein
MEKVKLFELEHSTIKISIEIYFSEKGQLIVDGYDIGKTVEDCWGNSDYEYKYTIEPNEVEKLYVLFGINSSDKHSLLLEIKKRFEGNEAYSKLGIFMNENNIKYTPFTWA